MANEFCFPKSTILNVLENDNYVVLECNTIIPDEYNYNNTFKLFVYMEKELYLKKKEKYQEMIVVGKEIYVAGKTFHEMNGNNLLFKVNVQVLKNIDYGRKKDDAKALLLELSIPKITKKSLPDRCEFLGTYYNDEEKSLGRKIIISIPKEKENILKDNTEYNVSGKLVIRKGNNQILPIVITDTFVKDIYLSEKVYIEGADNKWR